MVLLQLQLPRLYMSFHAIDVAQLCRGCSTLCCKFYKFLWPGTVVRSGHMPARGAATSKMRLSITNICRNHY